MISFYPGPSRVYSRIPEYVKDAYKKGFLSINHRSDEFVQMSRKVNVLLKSRLKIPNDYTIFFTGSATECWEIISQSLTPKRSYHIFNGAFGQKWYDYAKKISPSVKAYPFEREELINPKKLNFGREGSVICITQNETSNGTQVSNEAIREVKQKNPDQLVAIDATSSMGGIALDFSAADIWFASVQKCFGLPAGLGIMACSTQAIESASSINEQNHYNSLVFMDEMMKKWQTPFTPNVMNIYLLMRVLQDVDPIDTVHKKTVKRYQSWITFFKKQKSLHHLIRNSDAHSFTVLPITGEEKHISKVKVDAKKNDILLGEGYGELKTSTFRIANFPAIKKKEIKTLKEFFSSYD
jgi:phosphoserine aminotransferase